MDGEVYAAVMPGMSGVDFRLYSPYWVNILSTPALLDHTLGALADPTRRAILLRLTEGEARVTDIAAPFDISLTRSPSTSGSWSARSS